MRGFSTALAAALVTAGSFGSASEPTTSLDRYGDPLPPGAVARLGTIRLRQCQGVRALAFSPNGRALASGGYDDAIRLWDVQTGRLVRRYRGTTRPWVAALAFSPDGSRLASGEHRLLRLWDVRSAKELLQREVEAKIDRVAFAPDGHTLATADDDGVVRLWDVATGQELLDLRPGRQVAFSATGRTLAAAADNSIRLWDLEAGGHPLVIENAHSREVDQLVFTPGGKGLISGGSRRELGKTELGVPVARVYPEIHVWDTAAGLRLGELQPEEEDRGGCVLASSGAGSILASAHYGRIRIWDAETCELRNTIDAPKVYYRDLAISPTGEIVAAAGDDNVIRLWSVETGEPLLHQLDCHADRVIAVQYSPNGSLVATGSVDGSAMLWDPSTGQPVREHRFGARAVRSVLFSPDGETFLVAGTAFDDQACRSTGTLRSLNVATGRQFLAMDFPDRAVAAA
ncbi:MAG: WD40 repeat domain-containing protein, partial [Planctomycetota bacterium]